MDSSAPTCWCPLATSTAPRMTTSGHNAATSATLSGRLRWNDRIAGRTDKQDAPSWCKTDEMVVASSATRQDSIRSPKSITPSRSRSSPPASRPHQVVVRQITVHDLHGQLRCHALDSARLGLRHERHALAQVGVGDVVGEELDHPRSLAQVPLQDALCGRGRQTRQRGTHFAAHTTHLRDHRWRRCPLPCSVPPSRYRMSRTMCEPLDASSTASSPTRVGVRMPQRNPQPTEPRDPDPQPCRCRTHCWRSSSRRPASLRHIARARRVHEEEVRILLTAEVDGATTRPNASSAQRSASSADTRGGQLPRLEEVEARDAFTCGHLLPFVSGSQRPRSSLMEFAP